MNVSQELISRIESAFGGVALEGGISLNMTDYLDGYRADKRFLELAESDEKDDWKNIPDNVLERHSSTFPFTDWKGFRFYLPAYMRWCLRNPESSNIIGDSTIYSLDPDRIRELYKRDVREILDPRQLDTVIGFLEWCVSSNSGYCDARVAVENLEKLARTAGKSAS